MFRLARLCYSLLEYYVNTGHLPFQSQIIDALIRLLVDPIRWFIWLVQVFFMRNWNVLTYGPRLIIWTWKWFKWKPSQQPCEPSSRKIKRLYSHLHLTNPIESSSFGIALHPTHQRMIDNYVSYWQYHSNYIWQDIWKTTRLRKLEVNTSKYPPDGPILHVIMAFLAVSTLCILNTLGYVCIMRAWISAWHFRWLTPKKIKKEPPDPEPPPAKIAALTSIYSLDDYQENKSFHFGTSTDTCVMDNSANRHIWKNKADFIDSSFRKVDSSIGVATIGGTDHKPTGMGDVQIFITDEKLNDVKIILKNALYFPDFPVNIISVTALSNQL